MMRLGQIFFDQQAFVAKGIQGFAACQPDGFVQLIFRVDNAHPFAAAPRRRFDKHRISDVFCGFFKLIERFQAFIAGDGWNTRFLHQNFRFGFIAHGMDGIR